jgi:hypothetical protein
VPTAQVYEYLNFIPLRRTLSMDAPVAEIKEHFANVEGVEVNVGLGAQGFKWGKDLFVMFYRGQLLVKLSPERVSEIIASGQGLPHDPGTGKVMENGIIIPESVKANWIKYSEEFRQYVADLKGALSVEYSNLLNVLQNSCAAIEFRRDCPLLGKMIFSLNDTCEITDP